MFRSVCRRARLCRHAYNSSDLARPATFSNRNKDLLGCQRFYTTLTDQYKEKVERGELVEDPRQIVMLEKLESLREQLDAYQPPEETETINGLYVYGGVGCGKTMIMDQFYENIHSRAKLRTHFHDFMLDVHERIHKYKSSLSRHQLENMKGTDPIREVALAIASETYLLCFDEFQVTDVADAMIIKRLFENLFEEGIVMISTGNRPPDDLYKNGLQRFNFLPFIPLLKQHCEVLDMDSVTDYRLQDHKALDLPGGEAAFIHDDNRVDELFEHLTGVKVEAAKPQTLSFLGRDITVGVSHGTVLVTSYRELCNNNHGSSDFRALAKTYSHVLVKDFPQLSMKKKSPLRRFIIMMDLFYDRSVKLVLSCHVPITQIIDLEVTSGEAEDSLRMLMDDLQLTKKEAMAMSLFTGEDELFAHKRALSRLSEMQCNDYWELPHRPGSLDSSIKTDASSPDSNESNS
ncbi:AFG1-like ATPase isoform X2 [Bolinopsis microptera]|uniref:AFG1-like ATPase isoform X2 n=1 Tax=Bolinopsis microptera TaxID=2820187 RepID=UPI003078ABD7